ncbi:MAG: ParA family protein, partial [Alphaproteobacteria bacterium]|nr:ParA family protein [Alphaproteobacteria bacterium]
MVGQVITVAQRKGGAGKTTLAAQLAIAWARNGARVALLDIDAQRSLAAWAGLRQRRLGLEFAALPGWRAEQWIADRAREADFVIIDS